MRPSKAAAWWRSAGPALALLLAFPAAAQPAPDELGAMRQESIAAAHDVRQRERQVAALDHDIDLFGRDAAGRQRDIDESRPQQERLLGVLELLHRDSPDRLVLWRDSPIDRRRSEQLAEAMIPALRAEAHALVGEIQRIAELRKEIAAKRGELAAARDALDTQRAHLAALAARRRDLLRRLLPADAAADALAARLGREASDLGDLIRRADAAAERRDKALLARMAPAKSKGASGPAPPADPTRPGMLRVFDPANSILVMPAIGRIARRFGESEAGERPTQGISIAASPGAEVVAPFDGRVIYEGPFRDRGVVLIIRHGGLYHTVLAGLGRVDVSPGEWVLAGEPVGVLPGADDKASGGLFYVELRRDDRPVDPQPWLAMHDAAHERQNGDQRVRE